MITSDLSQTERRYVELRRYMDVEVTDGDQFLCASEQRCRQSLKPGIKFSAGQLSYVGRHYDLSVDGVPFRILVVAMDTGREDELVTLDGRREQVRGRIPQSFQDRNPHMRGTTSALRTLLGGAPGIDRDGEFLDLPEGRVHVLDAYAMANLRLCSATKPPSKQSLGTDTMSRACLRHLEATFQILEPTVVVLQGKQLRRFLMPITKNSKQLSDDLELVAVRGQPVVMASFSHPSYPATKMHWGRLTTVPYLWDTVVPQLHAARSVLLSTADRSQQRSTAEDEELRATEEGGPNVDT